MNKWHSLSTPSSSAMAQRSIGSLTRSSRACTSLPTHAASSHRHSPTNPGTLGCPQPICRSPATAEMVQQEGLLFITSLCVFALLCRRKQVNPRVTAGLGPASWLSWSGPQLVSISAEPFLVLFLGPHSHHGRGTLPRNLLSQRWCSPQAGHQGWRGSRTCLC